MNLIFTTLLLTIAMLHGARSEENCTTAGTYKDGNGTCVACPRGTFRTLSDNSTASSQCVSCSEGKTTEDVGSIGVFNCSIDICSKGQELNDTGACVDCNYDHYQDIELPTSTDRCKPCASNEATENTKSTNITACKRYCNAAGTEIDERDNCVPCPRGTYRAVDDRSMYFTTCINCTSGRTTEAEGSSSILNCSIDICSKGQELNDTGACVDCDYDHYQDIELPTSTDRCKPCASNEATENTKSTNITACKRYCELPGTVLDDNGKCVPCPRGTYRAVDDRSMYFTPCINCTSGRTTEIEGSTSILNCSIGIPVVTLDQNFYSVVTGQTVTIGCTVTSTPSHTNVYWQRIDNGVASTLTIDGVKYSGSTVNDPSLTITGASVNDTTVYTCSAINTVGTGTSRQTTLVVTGEVPVVVVKHPTYFVYTGHTVTLDCSVSSGLPHTAVYWEREVNAISNRIIINGKKYKGATVKFPSLIITNAGAGDDAIYTCSATNVFGNGTSTKTSLKVIGSLPVVTIAKSSYTAFTGETVTLGCTVTANPTLTRVIWRRIDDGVHYTLSIDGWTYSGSTVSSPSLVITNASASDSSTYLCSATNAVGTGTSRPISLNVTGDLPAIVIDKKEYTAFQGSAVVLKITVKANPNHTSISWLRIKDNGDRSTIPIDGIKYGGSNLCTPFLTIFGVRDSDTGRYECSVTNAVGTVTSVPINLRVIGVPKTTVSQLSVSAKHHVTLGCAVSPYMYNLTSVFWRRIINGMYSDIVSHSKKYQSFSVDAPSLTIVDLKYGDSGTYTCSATNAAGTGTSQPIVLTVFGDRPSVNAIQNQVLVYAGKSVTLRCYVVRNYTEFYWIHRTLRLSHPYPEFVIPKASMCDQGPYQCCAVNDFGSDCSSIELTVKECLCAKEEWE